MNTPGNLISIDEKILAKLQAMAETMSDRPPWCDKCMKLNAESTDEERLAVYQSVRRSGCFSEDVAIFLMSSIVGYFVVRDRNKELFEYEDQLRVIEDRYHFRRNSDCPSGAVSEGYPELWQRFQELWRELFAAKLDQFGVPEMANLARENWRDFLKHADAGEQDFLGVEEETPGV